MSNGKKSVGILATSPALASILGMVMDCEEHLVVHNFSHAANLKRHMRIAPIDIIVCDYEIGGASAAQLAIELRVENPQRNFEIIALIETTSAQIRQACKFAAIDEVIIKPMSPLFVRDRVLSRLAKATCAKAETTFCEVKENNFKEKSRFEAGNVIELFGANQVTSSDELRP